MTYPKCNLHTHSTFCDGADTPEETVLEAISRGMNCLGFSSHSYTAFDPCYCMSPEEVPIYRQELQRLKTVYGDRIRILCGIEQDFDSQPPTEDFDYVIGSVHYLCREGEYLPIDLSADRIRQDTERFFGGDIYRYLRAYCERMAEVVQRTHCDIVGHFDLVEKFNEGGALFDSNDPRYRIPLLDALDVALRRDAIIEINTGAMARGYRREPYPMAYLLRRIAEKRGRVMLNSDCHRKENLMFGYESAAQLAHSCGVGGLTVPGANGFETVPLR